MHRRAPTPRPGETRLTAPAGRRDAHVTVRTQLVLTGRSGPPRTPGRLHADQLKAVRASYVEVPEYETLQELLRSRHLLVLVGTPGSGRSTTAIRLLDDVTNGSVARLDPGVPAVDIAPQAIEKGNGYLGTVPETDARTSAVAADRFADSLENAGAYCVLVVIEQTNAATAFAAYATTCTPPDPLDLVTQHLDAGLAPTAHPELGSRLLGLADSPRLRRALGPDPRTHEAAAMARLLLAHGRGEIGVDDVESALAALLDDQIARWFTVLDAAPHGDRGERARRISALRIALAVFDGLPAHLATNAAALLAVRLTTPFALPSDAPPKVLATRSPVLTGEDDRMLVVSTRLYREHTTAAFRGLDAPAEVLRFADSRTPAALLRHVWTQRPVLRRPLLAWLSDMSSDPRFVVRTRAAQAAGLLCSVDFAGTAAGRGDRHGGVGDAGDRQDGQVVGGDRCGGHGGSAPSRAVGRGRGLGRGDGRRAGPPDPRRGAQRAVTRGPGGPEGQDERSGPTGRAGEIPEVDVEPTGENVALSEDLTSGHDRHGRSPRPCGQPHPRLDGRGDLPLASPSGHERQRQAPARWPATLLRGGVLRVTTRPSRHRRRQARTRRTSSGPLRKDPLR